MPDLWSLFDFPPLDGDRIEEYLDTILQRVAEWFDAPIASLFVADEKGTIRCRASVGVPVAETAVIEVGKGIAGSALLHGLPMLVADPMNNPLLANQIHETRKEISSAMVVPLTTSHEKLGVLNLARRDQDQAFDETDLKKANTLAHNISLAVANWKHLGDMKEISRVRRLAEIGQMTAAIAEQATARRRELEQQLAQVESKLTTTSQQAQQRQGNSTTPPLTQTPPNHLYVSIYHSIDVSNIYL